jgi:hypothetical protein
MMRLVIVVLAALIYSSQSSALLGGPRFIHSAGVAPKSVVLKVRSGDATIVRQDGSGVITSIAGTSGIDTGRRGLPVDSMLGWYTYQLEKRPATTKAVTSGLIAAMGDVMSQVLLKPGGMVDLRRVAVFGTIGGLYFAPVIDAWFSFLARLPFPREWSHTARSVAMTAIDQTLGAALITSGFFYAFELVSLQTSSACGYFLLRIVCNYAGPTSDSSIYGPHTEHLRGSHAQPAQQSREHG